MLLGIGLPQGPRAVRVLNFEEPLYVSSTAASPSSVARPISESRRCLVSGSLAIPF